MTPRVLVIIPAFNEEAALPGVIADIRRHQPACDIVVIDDGSTDRTAERAVASGAAVLSLPINVGIGAAVQTGFRYAEEKHYACAVQVDGDGQHPAEAIETVVAAVESGSADVAIGSRFLGPEGFRGTPLRRIGMWLFRRLIRLTTGLTITDGTSGFRAYNAAAVRFLAGTYPSDYPEVESVTLLHRNRFRIVEVAVPMRERQGGRSSITLGRAVYYMVKVSLASLVTQVKSRTSGR